MSALDTVQFVEEGRAWSARRRLGSAWTAAVAVVAAAGAVWVILAGDVLVRDGWFALLSACSILCFAGAGILWLRQRPESSIGVMLLALGGVASVQSFQGSSSPLAFSIGVLADVVLALAAWYLLLAFPTLRLSRWAAAVYSVGVTGALVGFVPWFFLSPHVAGATPLARCTAACPTNALMLANRPDVAGHFGTVEDSFIVAFSVAFLALVAARLAVATPPRRRVLAPVYAVGGFWLATFGAYHLASLVGIGDTRYYTMLGWLLTAARLVIPLAFVASLLVARVFAARALATMLHRVGARPSAGELERTARKALGDPSLRLALWHRNPDEWTDVVGRPVADGHGRGRSVRVLRSRGLPVAELRYDDSLDTDSELVDAAATAVLLSLERGAILSELRQSDRRVAAAGAAERRRIERNLHDGTQQRLVALRMRMAFTRELVRSDPDRAGRDLDTLGEELDAVLDEIRAVARGTYPPILREEGLAEALADAVRTHPRARLTRSSVRRYPEDIEAAVYFSAVEALQNATKHSGSGSDISVSLWDDGAELRFEVLDDGHGFDPAGLTPDGGLAGIRERLCAFGGDLDVRSAPGRGARVSGAVPLSS